MYDCQTPFGEGVVHTVLGNIYDNPELLEFQSPRGEGVVQTGHTVDDYLKVAKFQSPRGEGVVQTFNMVYFDGITDDEFQSPRGEGVVQTANPQACMVMRQTRI